jgi:hypothetical protein
MSICDVEYDMCGSTPSIFQVGDEYYINLRMVNYRINRANGSYHMSGDGKIVTANRLWKLSSEIFSGNSQFSFLEGGITLKPNDNSRRYVGIEDMKPYFNGQTRIGAFMGTIQSPRTGNISVGYGEMNLDNLMNSNITNLDSNINYSVVETMWNKDCEKNWVFYGDYNVVYSWFPFVTGKIVKNESNENNICELRFEQNDTKQMPEFFRDVRGSTHGCEFQDEIWFLCHTVEYCQPREYYHFFAVFDKKTMTIKRWSNLFKFDGEKIEYALGLIVRDREIIVSYSNWDNAPTIGVYDKFRVEMEMF